MKKILSICIIFLLSANLFGQVQNFGDIPKDVLKHLDKMGVDDSLLLNSYERAYFNVIFKDSLKGFDFTNKKVGFLDAICESSKKQYFKDERDRFCRNTNITKVTLYIFDAAQKEESGGYDAAIVSWIKISIPTKKIVKRLRNRHLETDKRIMK